MNIRYILSLLVLAVMVSCEKSEPNPPDSPKDRTVLVYQVADNNLGDNDYNEMDIEEMKTAVFLSTTQPRKQTRFCSKSGATVSILSKYTTARNCR